MNVNQVLTIAIIPLGLIFALKAVNPTVSIAANSSSLSKKGLYYKKSEIGFSGQTEVADFAAGCFWGVEQEFRKLPGVVATAVGYEGGHKASPTYKEVSNDNTGHAETVSVEYDPKTISYYKLLEVFWNLHDPTSVNQQGPDIGDQYRSAIFYYSETQRSAANKSRDTLQKSGELDRPIATEIKKATRFTLAEEYHQQYVEKGGRAACHPRKKKK